MKKNKPSNSLILFIVMFTFTSIVVVMPILIAVSKSSNTLIEKYAPELFIIYIIFWIVVFKNNSIENQKYIEETLKEETPRKAIITDILIYGRINNNSNAYTIFSFCPIVKELKTNKLYISAEYKNLGYTTTGPTIFSPLRYTLKSQDGNIIKIGDEVNLYIKNEFGKLEKTNDTVLIHTYSYKYVGKLSNFGPKDYPRMEDIMFNEISNNFMNDLDELNVFEGVIDFDAYK